MILVRFCTFYDTQPRGTKWRIFLNDHLIKSIDEKIVYGESVNYKIHDFYTLNKKSFTSPEKFWHRTIAIKIPLQFFCVSIFEAYKHEIERVYRERFYFMRKFKKINN